MSRSPCPSLVDADNENDPLKEENWDYGACAGAIAGDRMAEIIQHNIEQIETFQEDSVAMDRVGGNGSTIHKTWQYDLQRHCWRNAAALGEHATDKQQSPSNGVWPGGTICTAFCMPKDNNQDATRELTDVTATSAASQGHAPGMPPAPLPEQSFEPPGLGQTMTRLTTRFVEVAAGVEDEPVPQSPDWYMNTHDAFPDVIPPNQRPISVKMRAAQNLLDTLYCDGTKSRDPEYLTDCMMQPIRKRYEYIHAKARDRCATRKLNSRRSHESYGYTEDEWISWYKNNPLVGADITELMKQWKKEFFENPDTAGGMKSETKEKILQLERDGSRRSKKEAKELRRGSFKAYLAQECVQQRQLAMMFLIYPVSACDEILKCWANYMTDDEYTTEVNRSKKIDTEDIQAVTDREAQRQLTAKVHQIRTDWRRMRSEYEKTSTDPHRAAAVSNGYQYVPAGLTDSDQALYAEFENGGLLKKLNDLTEQHGFGRLYSEHGSKIIGSQRQLSQATPMDVSESSDCYFSPPWT